MGVRPILSTKRKGRKMIEKFSREITFPESTGIRCLMMPFIQGETDSLPSKYQKYFDIIKSTFLNKGDIGFLTIDESKVKAGTPHRGHRSKYGRALHTEAGKNPNSVYQWGSSGTTNTWGSNPRVTLDVNTQVLLANSVDNTCALWDSTHEDTSIDGDIGYAVEQYPYKDAILMKAGEVHKIGILTPHESLPVLKEMPRQFLRIISSGVHGREDNFTHNPLVEMPL